MSGLWLKMIGPTQEACPEPYERSYVDFSRRPARVHSGDHMILYAVGRQNRVFAIAEVKSEVYQASGNPDENGRWPYRVDIEYLEKMPASKGVHINEVSTPHRDLLRSLRQQSYISLSREEYERAATRLQEAASAQ
ncbi:MAG: hypothetical protein QOF02_1426 [Blastocatellia bacterium]|jgi:hypothetical protein|nr:hypothetical protein [Blastocatellia bacterium]